MAIRNAIAIIPVRDLKVSAAWYERLFGRGPDRTGSEGVREWIFEQGGHLQLREDAVRAGRGLLNCTVGDLDTETQLLSKSGIAIGEFNRTAGERVIMIEDPDGNSIAVTEILGALNSENAMPASTATGPHSLERALESIAADARLSPRDVHRFLDSLIQDLEALLRASEESSMSGKDPGLAAQLLQRAHIVRGKVCAPPAPP